jgi:hypothetical protein
VTIHIIRMIRFSQNSSSKTAEMVFFSYIFTRFHIAFVNLVTIFHSKSVWMIWERNCDNFLGVGNCRRKEQKRKICGFAK